MISVADTINAAEYRISWEVNTDKGWKRMERTHPTPEAAELHRHGLTDGTFSEDYVRNVSAVQKRTMTITFGPWEDLPDV